MIFKHLSFLALLGLLIPFENVRAESELKVGVMTHLTGDYAAWGQAYVEGITLGQEQVNTTGGVNGRRIILVTEDTRFDSALTASSTKKLLTVDHIEMGMVSTFTEVMVAGPMFERARVPLLVFGNSGGKIETIGKFIFSTGTWVDGYALSASDFLGGQLNLKNVAIVATNNAWSQSTADNFRKDFEDRGGKVTYRADVNPTDTDFRTVLEKIRTSKAEAIFAPITAGVVPFFEQTRRMKVEKPTIVAGGALDTDVIAAAPAAVEGRYVTNAFLDQNRHQAAEFLKLYRAKYDREPAYPSVSARGFDGISAIAAAARKASGGGPEALQEALMKLDMEAAGFHLKMDKNGTAKLPVRVLQVKNGNLVVVGG
jgi:branched-chain amino acid transport system substrate-binding protein